MLPAQKLRDYDKLFSKKEIERRAVQKYIQQTDRKTLQHKENFVVQSKDTLNANILLKNGDLTVKGTVNGDVLVLFGDVHLKENSIVNGNVTAVNGRIFQSEKSFVSGNQIETNVKNLFPAREFGADYDEDVIDEYLGHYTRHYNKNYSTLNFGKRKNKLLFRYNRVQGILLGMLFPKRVSNDEHNVMALHGFLGYGFADRKFRYKASLDHWLFNPRKYRFEIGASLYDQVQSKDNWLISPVENTITAFLLNDDYKDYYHLKGFELHASQNLSVNFKATLAYRNDQYLSVIKHTDWAIFKDKDRFPENPPIEDGRMKSWYAELYWDSRDNKDVPHSGWFGKLSAESSTKKMKSDFSFNQYLLELRRYQRLGPWERLDMRIKVATSEGTVPIQKRFRMGGISTLRAYGFRSVRAAKNTDGDRLILANFEYNISPRLFNSPLGFDEDVRYIAFLDLGDVWSRKDVTSKDGWNKGFDYLSWQTLKSDIGVGISNASGRFRINFAKRLDTAKKAFTVSLRLTKPF